MISFFRNNNNQIYAVDSKNPISQNDIKKLVWLFGNSKFLKTKIIESTFIGPRKTMVTPLIVLMVNTKKGKYVNDNLGFNLGSNFWHFLDFLWVYLFCFFYFFG